MIFDKHLSVLSGSGVELKYFYFLYDGVPVINASRMEHSFCTTFRNLGWVPISNEITEEIKVIFLKLSENNIFKWCSLYHELGHIKLNHPLSSEGRLDGIIAGKVSNYELEADNFAAEMMGRDAVLNWLAYLEKKVSIEIDLREEVRVNGELNQVGEYILKRFLLSQEEIKLRMKYIEEADPSRPID